MGGKSDLSRPGLCATLNQRVEDLRRLVPRAVKSWDSEAIHDARVSTRRLKAAIDLVGPLLTQDPKRRFIKTLRRLRRTLGPLRDLDVMLGHLEEFSENKQLAEASAWLSRRLQQERLKRRRKCTRKNPPEELLTDLGGWWGLEHEVVEAQSAARSLLKRAVATQLKSFCEKANQLAGGGAQNGAETTKDDVHALRIAGKLLRYTLELAEPLGHQLPETVLKSFKKLQDALGLWHDYVVLSETALAGMLDDHLALHTPRLYQQALQLARTCLRKSEAQLRTFSKLWEKDASGIEQQVQRAFNPAAMARIAQSPHDGNGAAPATTPAIPQLGACEK